MSACPVTLAIALCAGALRMPAASVLLPSPASEYLPPTGAPAAPGAAFTQSFGGPVANNAPLIAAWNESTQPGESLALTGKNFTVGSPIVWISNGETIVQATVVKSQPTVMTVTIPQGIGYGMYFLWIQNSAGISLPVAINRTNPQWIGPLGNTASPGSLKRVFGKDLSTGHGTSASYVYLQSAAGGPFMAVPVKKVEPYAVELQVPLGLAYADYLVYVHNGHGGHYGWGAPLALTVEAPWVRGGTVVSVPSSGGDDSSAIQSALNTQAAIGNGGTVQLNDGTYTIQNPLNLPKNVRLLGAGKDLTRINVSLTSAAHIAIQIAGNRVEIAGISFYLSGAGMPPEYLMGGSAYPTAWQDLKLNDIRVSANDPATGAWANRIGFINTRLEIANSEFFRELILSQCDHWVHDNVFHGGTYLGNGAGSEAAVNFDGLLRLVFENNTVQSPTWSLTPAYGTNIARRVFVAVVHRASVVNLYVAHNAGVDVYPGPGENRGELMLFHGEGAPWYGQAVSNSGATVTVRTDGLVSGQSLSAISNYGAKTYSGPLSDPLTHISYAKPIVLSNGRVGMFAWIVGGTGIGQIRQVAGITSNTITVSSPWRVPPDNTSNIVLNYVYKDVIMYANRIAAFPSGVLWTNSGASELIDFDGNSWFNVADSNVSWRTFAAAMAGGAALDQSWWNEIRGNQFLEIRQAGMSVVYWASPPAGTTVQLIGPATLGNVFRGNTIQITGPQYPVRNPDLANFQLGNIGENYQGQSFTAPFPIHESDMFENNICVGGRLGIRAGDWGDTIYRKNSLTVDSITTALPTAHVTPAPFRLNTHTSAVLIDNIYKVNP